MKTKRNSLLFILLLQLSVIVYTLAGVCGKYAANYEVLSIQFICIYCIEVAILGVYAIMWQQIIKNTTIFVAYANKGTALLWSLLWAVFLFKETISLNNIIGIIVVTAGVLLINSDSLTNKSGDNGINKEDGDVS